MRSAEANAPYCLVPGDVELSLRFGKTSVVRKSMSSLLETTNRLERIPIADGEVYYLSKLDLGSDDYRIFDQLIADVPWRQERILVWGKMHLQPRLVAWHGDRGSDYTYSGITLTPLPWSDLLLVIKRRI